VDAAVADAMSHLFGLFAKPQLSAVLLKRPPFGYVRSLVMAAMDATGVGDGLFDDLEAGRDQRTGKAPLGDAPPATLEVKARFLVKLLAFASFASGEPLDMVTSPSEVIAGVNPAATCTMLKVRIRTVTVRRKSANTSVRSVLLQRV